MIRAQESDISLTLSNVNLSDGKDEDTSATIGTGAEPGATKSTRDLLAPRDANTSAAVTEKGGDFLFLARWVHLSGQTVKSAYVMDNLTPTPLQAHIHTQQQLRISSAV
jgi:hypothetical protein